MDPSSYIEELHQLRADIFQRLDRLEGQILQGQATILVQQEALVTRQAQIERRIERWERAARGDIPPPDLGDGTDY